MSEEERKDNLVKAARLAGYNEVAAEQVANQFLSSDQASKEQLDAVYTERNLCVALIAQWAGAWTTASGLKSTWGLSGKMNGGMSSLSSFPQGR